MVKKLQKMAAKKNTASSAGFASALPAGLLDSQLAQGIKDSAQHIWAAGLGAFAKAQGEGGKVFEALVKEGLHLQKKTQSAAEEKLGAMASKVTDMAGGVGNKAGQHWDKLESIFEERVARALNRLGVPSAKDVAELIASIDALNAAVGIKAPAKKAAKAAAKAADKPTAKPAAKPAAKKVAAKAPAKAPVKAPVKAAVKAASAKAAPAKTAVKAAAKSAVKAAPKAAAKPSAKPATKAVPTPFKKAATKKEAAPAAAVSEVAQTVAAAVES
ncbi:phasin family protein [Paucibacter sp. TC2R-5]|uniref:phasin family protein n=1 Tax=Paucibacter sp. TC2R-5 TaxID=2893555 RepID=UPI0029624622|nr:phasin family protein [Paucibacter sp. TC2R-5]